MEVFLMMKLFVSGTEGQAYQEFQGRDLQEEPSSLKGIQATLFA
jgi:hypothetical protein